MFEFQWDGDESFEVNYITDGTRHHITSVNHDEDGWAGMTKIEDAFKNLSHAMKIPWTDTYI